MIWDARRESDRKLNQSEKRGFVFSKQFLVAPQGDAIHWTFLENLPEFWKLLEFWKQKSANLDKS